MKIGVAVVLGCLLQSPAYACDIGNDPCKAMARLLARHPHADAISIRDMTVPTTDQSLSMAIERSTPYRASSTGSLGYESAFARAIARAAKRSAAELALEAATRIIVMCQKERNPALTTPFFRSDSQQAHCFRY